MCAEGSAKFFAFFALGVVAFGFTPQVELAMSMSMSIFSQLHSLAMRR